MKACCEKFLFAARGLFSHELKQECQRNYGADKSGAAQEGALERLLQPRIYLEAKQPPFVSSTEIKG